MSERNLVPAKNPPLAFHRTSVILSLLSFSHITMPARQIFYTGRVQGVGFRYATKRLAMGFDVTGWVRNLPDGRVELQVESREAAELEAFLHELEVESSLAHHIKEIERHPLEGLAGVKGFSIIA